MKTTNDATTTIPIADLRDSDNHTEWRRFMAEQIAKRIDMARFGVKGLYLIGSSEAGTAGMGSDIDLLIHTDGDAEKRALLELWLDGWSRALAAVNYIRTGRMEEGLLDVHIVTDDEIRAKDSFAIMMRSTTESSRLQPRPG